MRVDGTDALNNAYVKTPDPQARQRDMQDVTFAQISLLDSKSIGQLTNFEKKELPVADKVIIDAIDKANKAMGSTRKIEFSVHKPTNQIMVKVVDSETNEVIREIPPEKILDLVAKLWEMAGILVDERR